MHAETTDSWWERPCGGRDVLRLALPLIISAASWSVMYFIDRMFLLWLSTHAMAAAMPAGMLHFALICFPLGIATYVNTFVAQYHGAGRPERIGVAVWQGVAIGLFTVPIFLLAIPLAPTIFTMAGHAPSVACLEVVYFQILMFAAGGAVISAAMSSFFTGRGKTRVVMGVNVAAALMNVLLDYAWIFGHFGFSQMGIEGAAWATVVAQWFKVLLLWYLMMTCAGHEKYQLAAGRRFDRQLMWRLLRFGGPNGLQMVVEIAAFTLFILLVGRLGEEAMAATTLAFNVNSMAFVPMLGMGIAVSTMVGQQLGRGRDDLAARATWTSFQMAALYMGTLALCYVSIPDLFLIGHAAGTEPEEFAALRDTVVVLLRFVAAYTLLDAANLVFVSAIKGAGDTRFVLITNLILVPMPLGASWWGIAYRGWGLIWCWVVITVWVCALGIIYWLRFLQGSWRHLRVIEAELLEPMPSEPPAEYGTERV